MTTASSLEEMLPTVNQAVDGVLRRRRKGKDFADDFRGFVMLKMLQRDGAILKRFRGESTLLTYLRVVVDRLYCDYLISLNGKWRSSKKAMALGAKSVHLEKLVYRDGYTLDQAVAALQTRDGKEPESELREGFFQIPSRRNRLEIPFESLRERQADTRPSVYEVLRQKELDRSSWVVRDALTDSLAELSEEDRLILELRFCRGLRIPDLSRRLGLKQRSVYNRFYRILRALREKLEARNVDGGVVREMKEGSVHREIEGAFAAAAARCVSYVEEPEMVLEASEAPRAAETLSMSVY